MYGLYTINNNLNDMNLSIKATEELNKLVNKFNEHLAKSKLEEPNEIKDIKASVMFAQMVADKMLNTKIFSLRIDYTFRQVTNEIAESLINKMQGEREYYGLHYTIKFSERLIDFLQTNFLTYATHCGKVLALKMLDELDIRLDTKELKTIDSALYPSDLMDVRCREIKNEIIRRAF